MPSIHSLGTQKKKPEMKLRERKEPSLPKAYHTEIKKGLLVSEDKLAKQDATNL